MINPWYIDITENWLSPNSVSYQHSCSIALTSGQGSAISPTALPPAGEDISVQAFIDIINSAFERAAEPVNWQGMAPSATAPGAETWIRYELSATGRLTTLLNQTEQDNNMRYSFAIRYNIEPQPGVFYENFAAWGTLESFTIQFRDGPHGYGVQSHAGGPRPSARVHIINTPDTRAVILPYSTHIVTILDKPPLPPTTEIVPFVGVSNKILFLLGSNTGDYSTRPVAILDADTTAIAEQYVAQTGNPMSPQEVRSEIENPLSPLRLQFKNDDPILKYQVFRITSKPESYADFNVSNNPHAVVTGDITVEKKASAAALLDDVVPNTKYYYCFRAIDVHNNFSNPTHVYEVELVDNDGQVYLILDTMRFTDETQKVKKSAKRYIYIEPSMRNLQIPESALPLPESVINDNPNPSSPIFQSTDQGGSCWNKTFKVRLTSKKSGKKIDLNILFKNTGVINP